MRGIKVLKNQEGPIADQLLNKEQSADKRPTRTYITIITNEDQLTGSQFLLISFHLVRRKWLSGQLRPTWQRRS